MMKLLLLVLLSLGALTMPYGFGADLGAGAPQTPAVEQTRTVTLDITGMT